MIIGAAAAAAIGRGAPAPTTAFYDAFLFDGSDDYISASGIFSGLTGASFSLWVYPTSFAETKQLYYESTSTSGYGRVVLNQETTGALTIGMRDTTSGSIKTYATPSGLLSLNTWSHVVGVIDTTNNLLKVYVDGVKNESTVSMSAIYSGSYQQGLRIGAYDNGSRSNLFIGSISNFDAFNRVVTDAEVTELYNSGIVPLRSSLSTGLTDDSITSYAMNSNDNSLTDLSTGGNNGTAQGGTTSNGQQLEFEL